MQTKTLLPIAAIGIGAYLLWQHSKATALTRQPVVMSMQGLGSPDLNANGQNATAFTSPFMSHLAPRPKPAAFWSEGGWVGPAFVKRTGRAGFSQQQAPIVVDAWMSDQGPVVGNGPSGATQVRCLVDTDGTVLQILRANWQPNDNVAGMGDLGRHHFGKVMRNIVKDSVVQPLKILKATAVTALAPGHALVTLVKTGDTRQALATMKKDSTSIKTAVQGSFAAMKQGTGIGVRSGAAPAASPGAASSGWPASWTDVPGQPGWQYGDVGDGTGNGLLQNVGLQVSFTATPAMISAAGGNPATVVANYLAANPSAQSSVPSGAMTSTAGQSFTDPGTSSGGGGGGASDPGTGLPIDPSTGLPPAADPNAAPADAAVQQMQTPAAPPAPKKVNWMLAGLVAAGVGGFMVMKK